MMNRNDEIEREVEDCCERSPMLGKHTYRREVCGHFEMIGQYYEEDECEE